MPEALRDIAKSLVAPGKGILAVDDFTPGLTRRFAAAGVGSTPETRRAFREMLFATPKVAEHVSGTILFDETFWNAKPPPSLKGIKLDIGQKPLAMTDGEAVTLGLDDLEARITGYKAAGAVFGKWRAVLHIGKGKPSHRAIVANAQALARYAAQCQAQGLVPIVEPDILTDGDHSIEHCAEVTAEVLDEQFKQLAQSGVDLAAVVLKPNMVTAGTTAKKAAPQRVAEMTVRVLKHYVPKDVAGIAFLSGGQGEVEATRHLNLIAKEMPVTFSFNRALQDSALKAWPQSLAAAQAAFAHRLKMNSLAARGKWSPELEAQ